MKNIFSIEKLTHIEHGCILELDQALTMLHDAGKRPLLINFSVPQLNVIASQFSKRYQRPNGVIAATGFSYKHRESGQLVPINHDESLDEFTFTVDTQP